MKRHPVTKDIVMLKNEDAIKRSLQNLVRTQLGERFFDSTIGTRITGALFELANDDYIEPIQTEIEMVVKNYEPRVKLNDVVVENYPDQNALDISIRYDIIGLAAPNMCAPYVIALILPTPVTM